MEVILLERVPKLGQMGDVVRVRDGYARNFLLPRGKALRATAANKAHFEQQRAQLEARNLELRSEAEKVAEKLNGETFVILRQAGETGVLYGSVATRDIAEALTEGGFTVTRQQIVLNTPIKTLGLHTVPVTLHPEVEVTITINVARSAEEAERQQRGEAVFTREETTSTTSASRWARPWPTPPATRKPDRPQGGNGPAAGPPAFHLQSCLLFMGAAVGAHCFSGQPFLTFFPVVPAQFATAARPGEVQVWTGCCDRCFAASSGRARSRSRWRTSRLSSSGTAAVLPSLSASPTGAPSSPCSSTPTLPSASSTWTAAFRCRRVTSPTSSPSA